MATFEITAFATLCKLLLAARKLATDSDHLNKVKALSDLAENGKALNAALSGTGLSKIAAAMEVSANHIDAFLTHEGSANEGARALFWQAAPFALEDPSRLTGGDLNADATAQLIVAAIHAR